MTDREAQGEPRVPDDAPAPDQLDDDALESVAGGRHHFPLPDDPLIPIQPIEPIEPIVEPLPIEPTTI